MVCFSREKSRAPGFVKVPSKSKRTASIENDLLVNCYTLIYGSFPNLVGKEGFKEPRGLGFPAKIHVIFSKGLFSKDFQLFEILKRFYPPSTADHSNPWPLDPLLCSTTLGNNLPGYPEFT